MIETFKGVNRRFLVPFRDETESSDREEIISGEPDYGFDDSEISRDGLSGKNGGPGGRAHGKSKLDIPENYEDRKKYLEECLDKEVSDYEVCQDLTATKDCVKEIVKDAFLRSKELAKAQKQNDYTISPIVDQKPRETEYEVQPGSMAEYIRIENSVKKELAVIQRRLFDLITDQKFPRWVPGADKGKRIDRRLIARVPLGERKFFKYKVMSDILDLAVMLLVDESGSMYGNKCVEARRCAVMFGKLLNVLTIPNEIIGFTTANLTPAQVEKVRKQSGGLGTFNRTDNLRHNMYKRFTDRYDQVKTKLVQISAGANNFDQDSLLFGWERLLSYCQANNVTRKLVIVVSDGAPVGGEEARHKLKRVIAQISCDTNAEIVGIGIETQYVKDFYNKCVEINDISQLGMNVVRLLEASIMKKSRKK